MVTLSQETRHRILRILAGDLSPRYPMDDEAASHGAIALWGTLGLIVGLRPDGTLWQFDNECEVPFAPLPSEHEISSLVYGTRRFPWLAELLPVRPNDAVVCEACLGHCFFSPTEEPGQYQAEPGARNNWRSIVCPTCKGLGWVQI